ncbi:MAG: cytochrome c biogenesis protein CcsA [Elusimicrobia bacterium]|nr:cytochrome c biogenesis protein CcsA [Elusimicrobiota bacterium]
MTRQARAAFQTALAVGLLAAAWPLAAPPPSDWTLDVLGRLPVLEGGRVKPLDSFARSSLLMLSGRQSLASGGRSAGAMEWLADALFRPERADARAVFTVDDPDLRGLLGLPEGPERRFAYWRVEPRRAEVRAQAESAEKVEAARRSRFQAAVLNLDRRLELYERIQNTLMAAGAGDPVAELAAFRRAMPAALRAVHAGGAASASDRRAVRALAGMLERWRFLARAAAFKPLPPRGGQPDDAWSSVGETLLRPPDGTDPHPGLAAFALMGRAYRLGRPAPFEAALREYAAWVARTRPADVRRAAAEEAFNRAQPFVSGMALYLAAFLAVCAGWATRRPEAEAAARGLLLAAFAAHTAGLAARMLLQGRPPVTNLYSSAVFVGWVGAGLGLLAERARPGGFAAAGGALLGFCTLLIAQHLAASGDTLEMMRAVLDSNFWLATHVVTVTIGYASTFLAGALGAAWVLRRHWVRRPDPESSRALASLAYGVVAFSLLFSFVGTMLGGIWADQSWGRFWGWDPKENGALLIVLWNAIILHARWSGLARERGIMVMTVFGSVVTSLSWFGVNMLGVGLHSYGFMDKAFWWLAAFVAGQLALMVLGLLPPRFWEARRSS